MKDSAEILRVGLDGEELFFLWRERELTPEFLDASGMLQPFHAIDDARSHARRSSIPCSPRLRAVDLDAMKEWMNDIDKSAYPASASLEAWNMFRELAAAARRIGRDPREQKIAEETYKALFWKDDDSEFTASVYDRIFHLARARRETDVQGLSPRETQRLARVLDRGLLLFERRLAKE